jgi:hypothetical protein
MRLRACKLAGPSTCVWRFEPAKAGFVAAKPLAAASAARRRRPVGAHENHEKERDEGGYSEYPKYPECLEYP